MLSIKLAVPILLDRQLAELSDKLDLPLNELRQLAYTKSPDLGIIYEDTDVHQKYDLIELSTVSEVNDDTITYRHRTDLGDTPYYAGFEAVLWLCKEKGVPVRPITDVTIPDIVFSRCDSDQWYDISQAFFTVELRSNRTQRLASLNAPFPIMCNEIRSLYESVEILECGKIGGASRRWNHGRMIRGLNDVGYSLIEGLLPGMQGLYCEEYDEYVAKERSDRNRMIEVRWYLSQFEKEGMDPLDALDRALRLVNGNPTKRTRSIEGMGFWLKDPIDPGIVFSFLDAHKRTFIQSEDEQRIYDQMKGNGYHPEMSEVFYVPEDASSDMYDLQYSFWGEAVAAIMTRETGLRFEAFYADPDNSKGNRSCILFPERSVWEYNEKEKKLSRNMLFQILDRYALELKHSVSANCYYIMKIDDCESMKPQGL